MEAGRVVCSYLLWPQPWKGVLQKDTICRQTTGQAQKHSLVFLQRNMACVTPTVKSPRWENPFQQCCWGLGPQLGFYRSALFTWRVHIRLQEVEKQKGGGPISFGLGMRWMPVFIFTTQTRHVAPHLTSPHVRQLPILLSLFAEGFVKCSDDLAVHI